MNMFNECCDDIITNFTDRLSFGTLLKFCQLNRRLAALSNNPTIWRRNLRFHGCVRDLSDLSLKQLRYSCFVRDKYQIIKILMSQS